MKTWCTILLFACLGCHSEPVEPPPVEATPKPLSAEAVEAWEVAQGMIREAMQAVYQADAVDFGNQSAADTVEPTDDGYRIVAVAFCTSDGVRTPREVTCGLTREDGQWKLEGMTW